MPKLFTHKWVHAVPVATGLIVVPVVSFMLRTPGCSRARDRAPLEEKAQPNMRKRNNDASTRVSFWQRGSKINLDANQRWVATLASDCEMLFTSANDVAREAVTKWTLREARAGEALELLYLKPKQFSVRVRTGSMTVDGLLIPLKPLHGDTVVIYHRLGTYSAGPLIHAAGKAVTDRLRSLLEQHRILKD